jgi:hypothetical protein
MKYTPPVITQVDSNTCSLVTTGGDVVYFDSEDREKVYRYNWYTKKQHKNTSTPYAASVKTVGGARKLILMHQLVMDAKNGIEIDHKDGNGFNNRKSNLRSCTRSQNCMNQKKKAGTSKYKGVSWVKRDGSFYAQIKVGGKNKFLGYFKTDEIAAARAYDSAARKYFGEFARCNFLEENEKERIQRNEVHPQAHG